MKNKILKRKNLRIPKYNYSNEGFYFITICTKNRECILSKIINDEQDNFNKLELLPYGKIMKDNLIKTNNLYEDIKICDYIIMPNHIHFIVKIIKKDISRLPKNSNSIANAKIPALISSLKRFTNKACKEKIWQRNYYEHIIRNEKEYLKILEYIQSNPYKWKKDLYYN